MNKTIKILKEDIRAISDISMGFELEPAFGFVVVHYESSVKFRIVFKNVYEYSFKYINETNVAAKGRIYEKLNSTLESKVNSHREKLRNDIRIQEIKYDFKLTGEDLKRALPRVEELVNSKHLVVVDSLNRCIEVLCKEYKIEEMPTGKNMNDWYLEAIKNLM